MTGADCCRGLNDGCPQSGPLRKLGRFMPAIYTRDTATASAALRVLIPGSETWSNNGQMAVAKAPTTASEDRPASCPSLVALEGCLLLLLV